MAFVPDANGSGNGYWLTVTLRDGQNDVSVLEYELTASTMVDATTSANTIITALLGVSLSDVVKYSISYRLMNDAPAFDALADNSVRARVVGQILGQADKCTFEIPAPKPAVFVGTVGDNANIVNLTGTEVVAYANIWDTGGQALISDGEQMDYMLKGRRVTRAKRFRS